MTKMNDNIGGFSKIEFVPASRIRLMYGDDHSVQVELHNSASWIDIPFQRGTVSIDVTPERADAGTLYSADVSIFIPRHLMTRELESEINTLEYRGGVLRYTTGNNEVYIVGSVEYPLQVTDQFLHPGAAAGFSGKKLSLTGKSTLPPLRYRD